MLGNRHRLRTQMSLAMTITAICSLIIFILGMAAFYLLLQNHWINGLSETNQVTLNKLLSNGDVDADALTSLIGVFSLSWTTTFANQEFVWLIILIVLSLLTAVLFGVWFAKRLSLPIEALTRASHQVAQGSLTTSVSHDQSGSLETVELFNSFNKMTNALERANRESATSAAAIAHELRTPLTILRGRLQGIRDETFEPTADMLDALISQTDTLSKIVSDLGTLSRLSAGQLHLELNTIDLAQEITAVITSVRPDLEKSGFQIHHELPSVLVYADAARIRQAMNAIITNAYQYASAGSYININTRTLHDKAIVTISDRGPGIAPEDRLKVFDRWWTGDRSRSSGKSGSGLGLSVVKAIIEAHNGTIRVEEEPGHKGCVISISLPLSDASNTMQ